MGEGVFELINVCIGAFIWGLLDMEEAKADMYAFKGKTLMGRPIRLSFGRTNLKKESIDSTQFKEISTEMNCDGGEQSGKADDILCSGRISELKAGVDILMNMESFVISFGTICYRQHLVLRPGGHFVWSATLVYRKSEEDSMIWKEMAELTKKLCWELVEIKNDTVNEVGAAIFSSGSVKEQTRREDTRLSY